MHTNWATIWNVAQPAGAASPSGGQAAGGAAVQGVSGGPVAQEAAPGPCGNQGSMTTIIMMVVMFAVFYFLLIRPQQK